VQTRWGRAHFVRRRTKSSWTCCSFDVIPHNTILSFEDQSRFVVATLRQTAMKQTVVDAVHANRLCTAAEHDDRTGQLSYIRHSLTSAVWREKRFDTIGGPGCGPGSTCRSFWHCRAMPSFACCEFSAALFMRRLLTLQRSCGS
jgi:hypothetical protein